MGKPWAEQTMHERAYAISPRTTRRVWRELTRAPRLSIRELAARLGLAPSTIRYAIERLSDAGYIEIVPFSSRARKIIVPFVVQEQRRG
jgi:DNA-binding MarR family transcriptional regulator